MPELEYQNLPFREAIKHIQDKLLVPSRQWEDMVGPVHAKAFTVAGATKLELLQDLYQAVHNAILDGTTITDFRKDFDNIVARHGWSYKGKRGWRTSVIFRTNKRTAFMAGKWEQFVRLKSRRPYLQYLTAGDERVRESHRPWRRIVLPVDHPFWKTHFPPNGWLCRCNARSLSKKEMERQGLKVSKMETPKPIDYVDSHTGETLKKFKGIDKGWEYNVGKAWLAPDVLLGQQLMDMPADLRNQAIKWFNNDIFDKPFERTVNKVAYQVAQGKNRISTGHAENIGYLSGQVIDHLVKRGKVPVGIAVVVKDSDIAHWLRDSKASRGAAVSVSTAASLPGILREPDVLLWDREDPSLIFAQNLGNGRYAKFVLRLNFKTKLNVNKSRFNETLNTFKSAGVVDWSNLNSQRYEVLQGELEK